jgi:hypothetical protein
MAMVFVFKPAERGVSIKPGVERSGTPGSCKTKKGTREAGDSRSNNQPMPLGYRTLRALDFLSAVNLGFRFTPGFMLPPATRVLRKDFGRFFV